MPCAKPLRTIKGRLSRAAMHAAGAAGAVVAIADCSSSPPQPFYGGACVGGSCIVTDAGADGAADAGEEAADAGKGDAPADAKGTD